MELITFLERLSVMKLVKDGNKVKLEVGFTIPTFPSLKAFSLPHWGVVRYPLVVCALAGLFLVLSLLGAFVLSASNSGVLFVLWIVLWIFGYGLIRKSSWGGNVWNDTIALFLPIILLMSTFGNSHLLYKGEAPGFLDVWMVITCGLVIVAAALGLCQDWLEL
jgi:hypothetical protein